jgi:chitinase
VKSLSCSLNQALISYLSIVRPKKQADGSCFAYDIKDNDWCSTLADANYLTVKDIENLNKNTWGFAGCDDIRAGQKICLSEGEPPMPNTIENAVCGPQKPNGEARGNKKLADMNPCPLNVCCNVWGQCGMDKDFCIENPADTKAPGTSKPGMNGCVSNCGMNITNNAKGPASFAHVAYFEAWNQDRPCLHMDVTDIDTKKYTHIHFAFPNVTAGDFKIDVGTLKDQFDKMKKMTGIKRIVSLGGWAFSADAPTYTIFRQAVSQANRATFADNVVAFVNEHGLDGIDFDWEYPGAQDITPVPGAADEGANYLEFLKLVKRRMGNKSVSIAAPASYWYLKAFPIKEMSSVLDYIIYMTYDLHGQWDHGNKWSSPGCPEGDCLRSHINMTETTTALAMITKAGVPSYKVVVGIASYGRSFKMAKEGCTDETCRFTGSRTESDALPGPCTGTGGYISSAEIREILWNRELLGVKEWSDDTDTDYLVYQDTEWVAWMNDETKQNRISAYTKLNFGGVSDWAVDLDKDYGSSGIGNNGDDDTNQSGGKNCPLTKEYADLEALANDGDVSDDCRPVLAISILEKMLDGSMTKYNAADNGYAKNFEAYQRVIKKSAEAAFSKFADWEFGNIRKYTDCDFQRSGGKDKYNGPCENLMKDDPLIFQGKMTMKMTIRDSDGFYDALEAEAGIISDWIELGEFKEEVNDCSGCQGSPSCLCIYKDVTITGIPVLKKDFGIPDPKEIIKSIDLEAVKNDMSARFFDIVAGIWDGSNGDVVQVLSVPVFLFAQAVDSMEEAKEKGGEIREEEKKNLILTIISALLFLIPFVGEIAAIAAGAATVARMIAMAGLIGNAAFTIADVVANPENAVMAIMGLIGAGRVRKPRDFADLGAARRAQTKYDISKMGATFKKHDDSLQKILGNCRRDGSKDDDNSNTCRPKRSLLEFSSDTSNVPFDARLPPVDVVHEIHYTEITARLQQRATTCNNQAITRTDSTITTSVSTYLTTPPITCKESWTQACYHYSSVMSVHTNTPDMVRFTCWETAGTSKDGKATDDWGAFGSRKAKLPKTAQHHWEWSYEWTEFDDCERDEWPPRYFWGDNPSKPKKRAGQVIRLIPQPDNGGAGQMWAGFCPKYDAWKDAAKGTMRSDAATTTSSKVDSRIGGGTTSKFRNLSVIIVMLKDLTAYITSVGVKIPNAVFEIKHWEHTRVTSHADDGLSENRCWPSTLVPGDPGFALLTNDPWYRNNPNAAINTVLYSAAPPKGVTSGKTKYRTLAGRPLIAARSMDLPDLLLGNATSPALGPPPSIIRADGPDQMVHALDVDEASFAAALRNASTVTRLLSTTPRRVMAQPSLLSVVDYIQATPGSPVYQGVQQPTGVPRAVQSP